MNLQPKFHKFCAWVFMCIGFVKAGVLPYGAPVYKSPYVVESPVKFLPFFQPQQYQQPLVVKAALPYVYHDIQPLLYSNAYQNSQAQGTGYQDSFQDGNNQGYQVGYGYQGSSGGSNLNGGYQNNYDNVGGYNNQGTYNNAGSSRDFLRGYTSANYNQGAYNSPSSNSFGAYDNLNSNNVGAYNNLGNGNSNHRGAYNNDFNQGAYNNDNDPTHKSYNQNNLNNVNNVQSQFDYNSFGNSLQSFQTPSKYSSGASNLGQSYTSSLSHSGDASFNDGRANNYQFSSAGATGVSNSPSGSGVYQAPTGSGVGLNDNSFYSTAQLTSGPSGSWSYPQSSPSNTATVVEKTPGSTAGVLKAPSSTASVPVAKTRSKAVVVEKIQAIDKSKEFEQIRKITSPKNLKDIPVRKSNKAAEYSVSISSSLKATNSLTDEPDEIIIDPSQSEIFGQRIKPGRSRNRSLNSPETTTTTPAIPPLKTYLPPERSNE